MSANLVKEQRSSRYMNDLLVRTTAILLVVVVVAILALASARHSGRLVRAPRPFVPTLATPNPVPMPAPRPAPLGS